MISYVNVRSGKLVILGNFAPIKDHAISIWKFYNERKYNRIFKHKEANNQKDYVVLFKLVSLSSNSL